MAEEREIVIDRLGAQGDGIADTPEGLVYVPFTLPGERARADITGGRGQAIEVVGASPRRIAPICRHFGSCGGCVVQHLQLDAYLAWKRQLVIDALADRGLSPEVEPTIAVGPGTRRRLSLAARRTRNAVIVGYHAPRGEEIVAISECPIARPELARMLPLLPALLMPLATRKGVLDVTLTAADNGIDVAIAGARSELGFEERREAADAAQRLRLIRVTVAGETLYAASEPFVRIGPAKVLLPPGAFLQATTASEAAMVGLVKQGVGGGRRIADLFAGLGTFCFALAGSAEVVAVETDPALLAALERAAKATPGLRRITALRRDLYREPLARKELEGLDAVVLDPPRAGAQAQSEALARSSVPRIVAVSCNPATLARDLRTLVDGGYEIERVVPIDQFVFSAHVEVVALLRRG